MIRLSLGLLAAALPQAKVLGAPQTWITGLSSDSREVVAGDLFACLRGAHVDASRFIPEAVRRGAVALLTDRPISRRAYPGLGLVQVPDVAQALMVLAPAFYGWPAQALRLIGVTGTSGKTTVTYLIREVLRAGKNAGPVGLIGTIRHEFPGSSLPAHNTTPPVWELQRLLHAMCERGCASVVMEVSSHALAQDRVAGCEFDAAVFTNLSHEHLDYHRTMAGYARAKQRLFTLVAQPGLKPGPKLAVVNLDDPHAAQMIRAARGAHVLTYGFGARADVCAEALRTHPESSNFRLRTPGGSIALRLPLLGEYNVSNALAAAAIGVGFQVPLAAIRAGLEKVKVVPGRMEKVPGAQPFSVLVDFAHKPDALEKVLQSARGWTAGRLLVVFGCGGERDAEKRPLMGAIGARLADVVVLTSDNPRSEDPVKIIAQVQVGCRRAGKPGIEEPDRRRAIRWALKQARPGDTVLLAGKGHESYQYMKNQVLAFSDHKVALQELKRLGY